VTVGVMYMMKLHHLVPTKSCPVHRTYSLVTSSLWAARPVRRPAPGGNGVCTEAMGGLTAGIPTVKIGRRAAGPHVRKDLQKANTIWNAGAGTFSRSLVRELKSWRSMWTPEKDKDKS